MNRIESLFARIFLIGLGLFFSIVMIEVAANYYLWNIATEDQFKLYASINQIKKRYGRDFFVNPNQDDAYSILFTPHHYLGYSLTSDYKTDDNLHNSLGFRGEEFSPEKPDGVYRIVAIGASTTYSTGVTNYRESYPYLLNQYLHDSGYDSVEVINAGVGGYTSYESLFNLHMRILPLDPDLIIIYHGSNDIHTRFVYPPEAYKSDNSGYRAPFVQDTVMPSIIEYSTALRIIGIITGRTITHSSIDWNRLRPASTDYSISFNTQYDTNVYPADIFVDVPAEEMIKANPPTYFEANSRAMISLAQAQDIDVLLVTYATSTRFPYANVSSEAYKLGLQQHNEITMRLAEETDSFAFDMASIFPEDEKYFTDGRHKTLEGNQLQAQLIGEYTVENILTR